MSALHLRVVLAARGIGGAQITSRSVYEVAPRGGEWTVSKHGVERPRHVEETKDAAVAKGIALGHNNVPAQLIIKKANGQIEEERTYGNDPYPPAG